jgi:integrase
VHPRIGQGTPQPQATVFARASCLKAGARRTYRCRNAAFYKAVFRPAVVRAIRAATVSGEKAAALPPGLTWHALRHTYATLCVAAGLGALKVSRFMGHSKPTTTLAIYTHLFNTDDHADAMVALGAMASARADGENVIPLHG